MGWLAEKILEAREAAGRLSGAVFAWVVPECSLEGCRKAKCGHGGGGRR
jgi:hypothetical protein